MGNVINAGMGLIGDITGTNDAAQAGRDANAAAMASQERMFDRSMDFQNMMFNWQKEQAEPWRAAGLSAMGDFRRQLSSGFSFTPDDDPIYQARLKEGTRAIQRSGAGRGALLSGRTLSDLSQMSSAELGGSYQRQYGEYNDRLYNFAALMSQGSGVSSNLGQIGAQFAQQGSNQMMQQGANLAQGYTNLGAINAQAAVAPFQNLMALGSMAGGMMTGAGAMGVKF